MRSETYDYRFPNSVAAFWIVASPPALIFGYALWRFVAEEGSPTGPGSIVGLFFQSLLILLAATVMVNAFPAIRLGTQGIELRFYFPFLSRWYLLRWEEITNLSSLPAPVARILRFKRFTKSNSLVCSTSLPKFYYLPGLLFGRKLCPGFVISHRIKDYEKVLAELNRHRRFDLTRWKVAPSSVAACQETQYRLPTALDHQ